MRGNRAAVRSASSEQAGRLFLRFATSDTLRRGPSSPREIGARDRAVTFPLSAAASTEGPVHRRSKTGLSSQSGAVGCARWRRRSRLGLEGLQSARTAVAPAPATRGQRHFSPPALTGDRRLSGILKSTRETIDPRRSVRDPSGRACRDRRTGGRSRARWLTGGAPRDANVEDFSRFYSILFSRGRCAPPTTAPGS
jgi:hypothetical protein